MAEDLRLATDSPVEFVVGIVSATLSALTFIVVLWTIGGSLTIPIGGANVTIPAFLVLGAILYAIIASGSMVLIARRFVPVAEAKNQGDVNVLWYVRSGGSSQCLRKV